QQWAVTVYPDGDSTGAPLNSSGNSVVFVVQNTGNVAEGDDYTLTCSKTGGITCGTVTPSSVHLNPGDTAHVTVTYSVGGSTGQVKLTAPGVASDVGFFVVTTHPTITLV